MRRALGLTAAGLAALLLADCARDTGIPKSEVYVLTDLSETWNNEASAPHNHKVLEEIGAGIDQFSGGSEPSVGIQYRVIGQVSLGRIPLCDAIYDPTQRPHKAKTPDYRVRTPAELRSLLTVDCPDRIVREPPEKLTEITEAINSAQAAMTAPADRRFVIVASDLLEESAVRQQVLAPLNKTRVLLIYRPVTRDLTHPQELSGRVTDWVARLTQAGAIVTTAPDESLKAASVAAFLFQK